MSIRKTDPRIGSDFSIPNINFNLNTSGVPCKSLKYLCVEFNVGDSPDTRVGSHVIPIRVYGVAGVSDLTPSPESLIGCSPFTKCTGKRVKLIECFSKTS